MCLDSTKEQPKKRPGPKARLERYARRKHWRLRLRLQSACASISSANPGFQIEELREEIMHCSNRVRYWHGRRASRVMSAITRRFLKTSATQT